MVKIRDYITLVLYDLQAVGFSSRQPASISPLETRLKSYARVNNISIHGRRLYTIPKAVAHMMRAFKKTKGIAISEEELCNFPSNQDSMLLFYDKYSNLFIYVDEERKSKFVIHPRYKLHINNRYVLRAFLLTTSRLKSLENFYRDRNRYDQI